MRRALSKLERRGVTTPRRHTELAFLSKADLQMTGWRFDELMDQGRKAYTRSFESAHLSDDLVHGVLDETFLRSIINWPNLITGSSHARRGATEWCRQGSTGFRQVLHCGSFATQDRDTDCSGSLGSCIQDQISRQSTST